MLKNGYCGRIKSNLVPSLFIVVLSLLLLSGCAGDNQNSLVVALDYTPNTNHTGMYVAKKLNYYRDLGIEVEFVQPAEGTVEQLVQTGQADFGITYQENLLKSVDHGMNLQAIYAIEAHNTSGFVSLEENQIKNPKDFEGKTYCGWGSDVEESIIKKMVEDAGGNSENVSVLTVGNSVISLDSGECDFTWEYEAWGVLENEELGRDVNFMPLEDYGIDWYTPLIISKDDIDPILAKPFVEATKKGYEYCIDNPDTAAQILVEMNPELDLEFIKKSQEIVSKFYDEKNNLGHFNSEIYDSFAEFLMNAGIIESSLDIDATYTNKYV